MKKGFTLTELLVCLALLGVIMVVALPNIIGAVNRNQERQYESVVGEIISSAEIYVNQNRNRFTTKMCDPNCVITYGELILEGLVDPDIKNPKTSSTFSKNAKVFVTVDINGKFNYEFEG